MKTKLLLFLFAFLLSNQFANGQNIYLPDANWRSFLVSEGLGSCIIGDSLDTTCSSLGTITSMSLEMIYVTDVSGIEYLTNLRYLNLGSSAIGTISAFPPNLDTLIIGDNVFSSLPSLPSTLIDLEIGQNFLTTLPSLPASLLKLVIDINQLTSLPNLPSSLIELRVSNNSLSVLPVLPSGLQILDIESCQLSILPALPATLLYLNLKSNQLTSISSFPSSLIEIDVSSNQILSLPALPISLTRLNCTSNHLTALPALPSSLEYLSAGQNQISSLPAVGSGLQILYLQQNLISSLPALPSSLRELNISVNQFVNLPTLPDSLTQLAFSDNQISQIDSFPEMVQLIAGWNNQLVSVPAIPLHCVDFFLSYNSIVHIPAVPNSVRLLDVSYNAVQDIVSLPDSLLVLHLNDNPLNCLPPFIYGEDVMIENTNIHCLPSLNMNALFDINVSSFPACQPSSGCEASWNISGKVYNDISLNCVSDPGEQMLKHIRVELDSAGIQKQICYTNNLGEYTFRAPLGNYDATIDTTNLPFYINCPSVNLYNVILTPTDSMVDSLDFALTCKTTHDLSAISIHSFFRPGVTSPVDLLVGDHAANFGTSCYNGPGTVYATFSNFAHYASPAVGALTPTSVIGDSITWSIADMSVINPQTDFNINVIVDTNAVAGDTICVTLGVLPSNDENPYNNFLTECFPVSTSFDPNDKWMSPSEADTSMHEFTFTVNFQNTGNYQADNIYILDTLDTDFDASTFQMIASDHDVVTQLLPGNILRFNFHAINLPDSTSDEPHSHGFVKYRINRKSTTGLGTEISNTANIFFDYNQPVVTNTVSTTISASIGMIDLTSPTNNLSLYPNPVSSEFYLSAGKEVIQEVRIFNILGKEVFVQNYSQNTSVVINVSALSKGSYCVRVRTQSGFSQKLFMKQ